MRKGLFTLLSLVCAGLIWAAPAPANAADKIVIRFAHSNTPSDMDPYHALVTKMNDKLVKKLGADRIEIQEFPAGQIGSEERSFQDVQQGVIQIAVSRGQQRDGVQPLTGRVRPAVHVHQL